MATHRRPCSKAGYHRVLQNGLNTAVIRILPTRSTTPANRNANPGVEKQLRRRTRCPRLLKSAENTLDRILDLLVGVNPK